jgi:hypothetical protein
MFQFYFPEFWSMDEFELSLQLKGKVILLPVKLMNYGRSYKLEVEIEGTKVLFEPDEERNWRAMISYEDVQEHKILDTALLELIVKELDSILK